MTMALLPLLSAYILLFSSTIIHRGEAFGLASSSLTTRSAFAQSISGTSLYAESEEEVTPDNYDLLPPEPEEDESTATVNDDADDAACIERATELKRKLYQLAASYDRGFSATPNARTEANDIIEQLSAINPTTNAANGIDGESYGEEDVPLKAIWRMVWTSAFDVVSLGASPFAAPSAIYQDIRNPPAAINIIDFIPRAQTFFPSNIAPASLLRAEVATRGSSRKCIPDNNRVGLVFEGIKLQPVELLGQKVDNLPPLEISFMWQRDLIEKLIDLVPGIDKESLGFAEDGGTVDVDAPGYFDVEYLDDELLVIQQQAPGGVFALIKVDSCEP